MTTTIRLQGLLLCGALAAFIGAAQADSHEDAVTKMDEAAETEATKAKDMMDEKVEKMEQAVEMEKEDVRGKSMEEEEVSGD